MPRLGSRRTGLSTSTTGISEATAQGLIDDHADLTHGAAIGVTGAAHGAETGLSKVAKLRSREGTAEWIFVFNIDDPPTGVYLGDLWAQTPSGTMPTED
jgi:hypothetical protein